MPAFKINEIITYYDGIQLAFMLQVGMANRKYLVVHSVDDGTYLATRVSADQKNLLDSGKLDVKSAMQNPFNDEIFIILDPLMLPISQQHRFRLDEYYGFPVQYDTVFEQWAIPDSGLFITNFK